MERASEKQSLADPDDRVAALRRGDYGAIARAADAEAGISTGVHVRQRSFGPYSRQRLLTVATPGPTTYVGDFTIHDLLNEKTRSYTLEAERRVSCLCLCAFVRALYLNWFKLRF